MGLETLYEFYGKSKSLLSRESPRHSSSSIFFVIILVTSWRSSFSLSSPELPVAARVSWYNRAVLDMNVSVYTCQQTGDVTQRSQYQSGRMRMVFVSCPLEDHNSLRTLSTTRPDTRRPAFSDKTFLLYWGKLHCLQWGNFRGVRKVCRRRYSGTYCNVYSPLSIEHRGSEFGVIRRKISFACCLCSWSDFSV